MPSPSFSQAIELGTALVLGRRRIKAARFTAERVQETLESGEVVVLNRTLPVTGEVRGRIRPGDDVVVAWNEKNEPKVIIKHQARRAQPPGGVEAVVPILEELIRAPITAKPADANKFDIWFRNAESITRLGCFELLGNESAGGIRRAWGRGRDRFLVNMQAVGDFVPGIGFPFFSRFPIFAFDRDPDEVITDEPTVTLLRTDDPTLSPLVLGDVTIKSSSLSGPFTVTTSVQLGTLLGSGYLIQVGSGPTTVEIIRGAIDDWYLDSNGDTILTVRVIILVDPVFAPRPPFNYPVVVNLTRGTILYNGLANAGADFGNPPNTFDGTDYDLAAPPAGAFYGQHMVLPLAETEGQLVALCAASTWVHLTLDSLFQASILPQPTGTPIVLAPQAVSGPPAVNTRFIWPMTYNSRFLLWAQGVATNNVSPMQTSFGSHPPADVHLTDFRGRPPTQAPETVTVAVDMDGLLGQRPTLLTPNLLLFDPDGAEPFFVTFLGGEDGEEIVLDQGAEGFPEPLPEPFDVAAQLAEFDEETAFVLDRVESLAKTRAGYATYLEGAAWQVIPDPASGIELPEEPAAV